MKAKDNFLQIFSQFFDKSPAQPSNTDVANQSFPKNVNNSLLNPTAVKEETNFINQGSSPRAIKTQHSFDDYDKKAMEFYWQTPPSLSSQDTQLLGSLGSSKGSTYGSLNSLEGEDI
jgi:hypothetical protein